MTNYAADITLMRAVSEGDTAARQDLVRRLLPRAQRVTQALLRNSADAKDASQSAILQVLRSAHTYRGECAVEHWADRIVTRTALRWVTAERARRHDVLTDEPSVEPSAGPPRVLLRQCLSRLSEPQRTALLLRAGFEYSVEEIATLTEVSPNTVKDRLTRARHVLRALVRGSESVEPEASSDLGSGRGASPPRSPTR